jgi:hypothetical protein
LDWDAPLSLLYEHHERDYDKADKYRNGESEYATAAKDVGELRWDYRDD